MVYVCIAKFNFEAVRFFVVDDDDDCFYIVVVVVVANCATIF